MKLEALEPAQAEKSKSTFKIAGVLYREIYINCGKPTCKKCTNGPGHLQYHQYAGNGQWIYLKQPPQGQRDSATGKCQRQGCENETARHGQKYCTPRCRVAANRAAK